MHAPRTTAAALLLLAACGSGSPSPGGGGDACAYPSPAGYTGNGSATHYLVSGGAAGAVACGYDLLTPAGGADTVAHVSTGAGTYFAALNSADFDAGAACGRCAAVSRDDGRQVVVTIVDECPTATSPPCTAGHLDLSEAAFQQLGALEEGYLGTGHGGVAGVISWRYVPCPTGEQVVLRLKEPDNAYWNQVQVAGQRNPLATVELRVSGGWQAATHLAHGYWQVGGGDLQPSDYPLAVRATDYNGSAVTGSAVRGVGGDQATGQQFAACQ